MYDEESDWTAIEGALCLLHVVDKAPRGGSRCRYPTAHAPYVAAPALRTRMIRCAGGAWR